MGLFRRRPDYGLVENLIRGDNEAVLLCTEITKRPQGERTDLVDNVHKVDERPSGTSAAAGLRKLQKAATEGNEEAADRFRPGQNEMTTFLGRCFAAHLGLRLGEPPVAVDPKIAAAKRDERRRVGAILSMAEAKRDPKAAYDLALGSDISIVEARTKLQAMATTNRTPRQIAADSMRRACGLPTANLRPGEISGLRHVAKTGTAAQRKDATARLRAAGLES